MNWDKEKTTLRKLKKGLIELLRGYPDYRFFGKIEYFLRNNQSSIEVLSKDKIIELASKKEEEILNKKLTSKQLASLKEGRKEKPDCWYRLTSKGVDLAISMINLEYSEKTNYFTKIIKWFTGILIAFAIATFLVAFVQSLIMLYI